MALADVPPYLALVASDREVLAIVTNGGRAAKRDVSDWQTTLVFYMACIYVKALGRLRGKDLQDHFQIKQWLNTTADLVLIAKPYRKLEDRSRDARYEGRRFATTEMEQHVLWFEIVRGAIERLLRAGGVGGLPAVDVRLAVGLPPAPSPGASP